MGAEKHQRDQLEVSNQRYGQNVLFGGVARGEGWSIRNWAVMANGSPPFFYLFPPCTSKRTCSASASMSAKCHKPNFASPMAVSFANLVALLAAPDPIRDRALGIASADSANLGGARPLLENFVGLGLCHVTSSNERGNAPARDLANVPRHTRT
jgi:hypothetical protein